MELMSVAVASLAVQSAMAELPTIWSLDQNGRMVWTNGTPGTTTIIQRGTNLDGSSWQTLWYDTGSVGLHTNWLPAPMLQGSYYRLAVQTNVPDPTLVLYLPFDNNFTNSGVMLDVSGFGQNGLRYATNLWPSPTAGPDGSVAGEFHTYAADANFPYGSGDYIAVWDTPNLNNLTNGTLAVWAHYKVGSYASSALVDAAYYSVPGSWTLGRTFQMQTTFDVVDPSGSEIRTISFPDTAPGADTGGWHHYCITFDGSVIKGYFDGVQCGTASQTNYPALKLAGYYIAIGCRGHLGTPQVGDDQYPNNGWFAGSMDDVRIYNRALSASEEQALYTRMHKF